MYMIGKLIIDFQYIEQVWTRKSRREKAIAEVYLYISLQVKEGLLIINISRIIDQTSGVGEIIDMLNNPLNTIYHIIFFTNLYQSEFNVSKCNVSPYIQKIRASSRTSIRGAIFNVNSV